MKNKTAISISPLLLAFLFSSVSSYEKFETVHGANDFIVSVGSARSSALAGALVAASYDISSGLFNPAAISGAKNREISVTREKSFGGMQNFDMAFLMLPLDNSRSVAVNFVRSAVGNIMDTRGLEVDNASIPIYDRSKISTISNNDMAFTVSYGSLIQAMPKLRYGLNTKFIRRAFGQHTAYGAGLDGGAQIYLPNNIIVAASIKNIGTTVMRYNPDSYEISPPELTTGISGRYSDPFIYGTISAFYESPNIMNAVSNNWGAVAFEYSIFDRYHLRVGSNENYKLTYGGGISVGRLSVDVALRKHYDLPQSTQFSFGWKLI